MARAGDRAGAALVSQQGLPYHRWALSALAHRGPPPRYPPPRPRARRRGGARCPVAPGRAWPPLPAALTLAAACALAGLGAGAAARAQGGRSPYTPAERGRLERGEVVTRHWKVPGEEVGQGWAAGVVDGSPENVFAVVRDVERYPQLFARMSAARVIRRYADGSYDFFYRVDMPWPLADHWCITHNVEQVDSARHRYRRAWQMVRGTFVSNRGSWSVSPWRPGRSLLHYEVKLRPRSAAPGFVLDHVSRVALPRSVAAVRDRVRSLRSAAPAR